jgi:RND family efflux transporter MFP subunit
MKQRNSNRRWLETSEKFVRVAILSLASGCTLPTLQMAAKAVEIDGFTEPNRSVDVAAAETGTIKSIQVREGQRVVTGDVLAKLDDEEYVALLAIAKEAMQAQGQLKSAEVEVRLRQQRLQKLESLRINGHARQEEVERAHADLSMAEARLLGAKEMLQVKKLEYEKIQVQLARRTVRSPINGVINRLLKNEGEFVAPNDPYVLQLVELDPLIATFSIPSYEGVRLKEGDDVSVFLEEARKFVAGTVDFVAPVTDAESGTVRVKISIPNHDGQYRSGERCTLHLESQRKRNATGNPRSR